MYTDVIKAQEQAICHLFFHCCLKDGVFSDPELTAVSSRLVDIGLYKQLDFKDEVLKYQSYKASIVDDTRYLEFLIKMIVPVNTLALFSYCVELILSDSTLDAGEESLLTRIGNLLELDPVDQAVTRKLMAERKVVTSDQIV
jgi:uncharacterized tellurite resistance protein B-like protein